MTDAPQRAVLFDHLRERFHLSWDATRGVEFDPSNLLAAIPLELNWLGSERIAHQINGYELSPQLGLGEVAALANGIADQVIAGGEFPDSFEVLWLCLFYEHRRWRHFGTEPESEDRHYLDRLCQAFARQAVSRS